jgi:hypothetical protein
LIMDLTVGVCAGTEKPHPGSLRHVRGFVLQRRPPGPGSLTLLVRPRGVPAESRGPHPPR